MDDFSLEITFQDMIAELTKVAAICPRCGHLMTLVRTVPKLSALPELLIFRCPACNEVETKEDPVETKRRNPASDAAALPLPSHALQG